VARPGALSDDDAAGSGDLQAFDFKERVDQAPDHAGVYLMKDRAGEVIYVGKAKSLRARLRQYLLRQDDRFFVHLLASELGDIELLLTNTAKDALLLENELIKKFQPRYNVKLKDDKRFIHLRIGRKHAFPRLQVVRKPARDGARYFGPYASASSARATLRQVNRYFKLRTCSDQVYRNRSRPCLEYQIKRCPAPCVLPVESDEYARHIEDVAMFLDGRRAELVGELKDRMFRAAGNEEFEHAAMLRDQWRSVQRSLERQHTVLLGSRRDIDAIGIFREGARLAIAVLRFRTGTLLGSHGYALQGQEFPDEEVLAGFVQDFYNRGHEIPDDVLLPDAIDNPDVLAEWLTDTRRDRGAAERLVKIAVPSRGSKKRLVQAANDNAAQVFEDRLRAGGARAVLQSLRSKLELRAVPERIECYDISNIQGTDPVASMVVFEGGEPARKEYRSYKIRYGDTPNDFAMMYEVLNRRFSRGLKERTALPDLVVVDGGIGQLKMAVAALQDLGVHDVDVVGLAKARTQSSDDSAKRKRSPERVFQPGKQHPVVMSQTSDEVFLLTRLRDEAHRFAITFHRKRRAKRTLKSALDDIPGVGPARRKALLQAFGSVKGMRTASVEQLSAVNGIGPELAKVIAEQLGGGGNGV